MTIRKPTPVIPLLCIAAVIGMMIVDYKLNAQTLNPPISDKIAVCEC